MKKYAVIVAGGAGSRMGAGIPKQFLSLNGHPVLWWSIRAFRHEDPETKIIVVLPQKFLSLWQDFYSSLPVHEQFPHVTTIGGSSRFQSVKNGLMLVDDPESLVAVHDGARPLVSEQTISQGWLAAQQSGAAIPVVSVVDSLRRLAPKDSEDKSAQDEQYSREDSKAVPRAQYVAVQTPQVFHARILKDSYQVEENPRFTDDASVVENAGYKIALFPGNNHNLKITHDIDLDLAGILLCRNS